MDLRAPTVRRLAFALATVAVVAVIIAWRKSDAIINPQLVAEDGAVFFVQAYERPPFHAWFLPYGGYLHLLPRIVADVALYFDAAAIPHIYAYAALALNLWVAVVLCSPRLELGFLTRTALALAYALVPHTGEVFVSLTNVQWTLAPVLVILVLLRDASTPGERVRDFLSIGVIGLTGPFIVFLLPLFIGRLVARRSRESVFLAAVATVVALVQLSFLLRDQAAFARSTPIDLGLLLPVLSARTFGTMWGGYGLYSISSSAYWLALGIVGVGVLATLALVPGRWREYRTVIGAAFILFSLPVAAKFLREAIVLTAPHNGDRYFFPAHLTVAWLLVLAAFSMVRWIRAGAALALVAMVVINFPRYQAPPLPDLRWADHADAIRRGERLRIPINPDWTLETHRKSRRR